MNLDSEQALVSIVIPTYNHADFLKEAITSVIDQSYSNWEVIVVNNYSDDDTIEIVKSFSEPRIHLFNFHNNGIIGAARNHGILHARGDFLAFLDSDDSWLPDKLERCLQALDENTDLVCHALHCFGDIEKNMFCGPASNATFDALLNKGNCLTPSAVVVRKQAISLVEGFSEEKKFVTSEDYHLWIKLAQSGARMKFINDILANYRIHAGNQSGDVLKHLDSVLHVIQSFYWENKHTSILTTIKMRRRYAIAYYGAARAMQKSFQFAKAWPLLLRSFLYWPFIARNYLSIIFNLFKRN